MATDTRLTWVDALRLMAGLSMVGLHATADPSGQPWPGYSVEERIGPIIIRSFLYIARTELFIIISVFLLLLALERRPRSYRTSIVEQSRRLLIPFAFWTVFYAFYGLIKANAFGYFDSAVAQLIVPWNWVGFFVLGDVKYHMHFIPTLFGVLLMYPLYRIAIAYPWLGILILICLLTRRELDDFAYQTLWGTEALGYAVRAIKIITYAGYGFVAAAAYGIYRTARTQDLRNWLPLALFGAGLIVIVKSIGGYKTIITGAYPFEYTAVYWADFLMPAVLFMVCLLLSTRNWPAVLTRIAPYSFGVYLCHPIFLDLAEIYLRSQSLSPTAQVGVKIAATLFATALFVIALRHLSLTAWTIGLGPVPRPFSIKTPKAERV